MGLHQWKKYRVNYEKIWEAIFNENLDKYEDFIVSTNSAEYSKDIIVYTGYTIRDNGDFDLTNSKEAGSVGKGDVIYFYYTGSSGDNDYDRTYHYGPGRYNTNHQAIHKFYLKRKGSSHSTEHYDGSWEDYYLWSEDTANNEGYYTSQLKQTIAKQGSYVGLVQGQEEEFPQNGQKDGFWYVYDKKLNDPPTKPERFILPTKIFFKTSTIISWSNSTDPESDPISYKLERSLDGKEFVQRYKGPLTSYEDIIEEEGHTSVVYRVTAIDSYGGESPSLASASIPVSDNIPPIINTSSTDLGKIDSPPTIKFTVKDPDKGQTGQASTYLDDKMIDRFSFVGSGSSSVKINDYDWLRLLNGKHTIKISTKDSEGASSSKAIVFEKAITNIDFELIKPLEADAMVTKATINLVGSIPKDAIIKVEACNNGYDKNPTWEDVTIKAIKERKIFFANKTKTADKWGVNIRVSMDRNGATGECYISSIGGSYE